jgi:hypothetical protein
MGVVFVVLIDLEVVRLFFDLLDGLIFADQFLHEQLIANQVHNVEIFLEFFEGDYENLLSKETLTYAG